MSHRSIQLVAAIVNRGAGNRTTSAFHICNHEILLVVRRHGTASSTVVDCLGLGESEKDLVLGLSNKSDTGHLLHVLGREVKSHKLGHDITFTLSLSGISLAAVNILSQHEGRTTPNSHTVEHKKDISMTNFHSYELIASVIHTNLPALVMEAARKTGCQGGTLIKVREIGTNAGKKLSDVTLSQERAILLILTPADLRLPVLKATCETVMKETGEHVVVVSLPVGAVGGLAG